MTYYITEKRSLNKVRKQAVELLKEKKRKRIVELIKEVGRMKESKSNLDVINKIPKGLKDEDIRTMTDKIENLDEDIENLTNKIREELREN
jgi:transposase